ncbi:MAG TPA: UpxY family transcription antiterminator [Chitinophagaceae bacterium]|jgi:transcription antitermination factor NusG
MLQNVSRWYAVYTRPRWEKKVAESLTRKKIENYCPLNRVLHQWSDRKKIVLEPLFTSYVFVRISSEEQLAVRQTEGVINFVYWLKKPAIIRNEEMETIKKFLNDHINVRLEKIEVNTNDIVKIVSGPLMLREGKVIEIMNRTVKVLLPSLGYSLIAQVDKLNIEKVGNLLPKAVAFE